jgi:hypothetical protein
MNTKERKRKDIEMRYAYMLGYHQGFKDAIPMEKFVSDLMEMMDPVKMKKIEKWAEKQMEAEQAQRAKTALERLKARQQPQSSK